MKWILDLDRFFEAKIGDLISDRQKREVKSVWGESYLDYEDVDPTDNIEQGEWKLSEDDKMDVMSKFFQTDMREVYRIFDKLSDRFELILKSSIDVKSLDDWSESDVENLSVKRPSIEFISKMYSPIFKSLSVGETKSDSIISRDGSGRPIMGDDGNIVKVPKISGDPIYSSNLVNITGFIEVYNRCYSDDNIDMSDFRSNSINAINNISSSLYNSSYKTSFDIFDKDIYLKISHNPKDILNMSISKFYSSCQHLYTGDVRKSLLGNVFDSNSIPAFLIFKSPIFWDGEEISQHLPLSRKIIRNIDMVDSSELFFDRTYPDRMDDIFSKIIEKYTNNKQSTSDISRYTWSPDIDTLDPLQPPYMDRLELNKGLMIGRNTKNLYLSSIFDWSNLKVSPNAIIDTVVIETTDVPSGFLNLKFNPKWVKFRSILLKDLSRFELKSDFISFEKCVLGEEFYFPDIYSKVKIISCDISSTKILLGKKKIKDLELIFSMNRSQLLEDILLDCEIKSLSVSGDIISNKNNKNFIFDLRKRGIKVKIIGPSV